MRRYHKAIVYFAMSCVLSIGGLSYGEVAKASNNNNEIIEEEELDSKYDSKYDSLDDTTLVSSIIKDSNLYEYVRQTVAPTKNSSNFTKADLVAYEGALDVSGYANKGSITSVEGLGCAKNVTNINLLGTNITEIPDKEFEGCTKLENFTFPARILKLGESAFYSCTALESFTSVKGVNTLPDTLTTIGQKAFANDFKLSEIKIPKYTNGTILENATSIFSGCQGLKKITIDKSITVIPASAFAGAGKDNPAEVTIGTGTMQILSGAFEGVTFSSTTLDLGDTHINSISSNAFYNTNLETVLLPKSSNITELILGANAFAKTKLTSMKESGKNNDGIYFPDYITRIGAGCFFGDTKMTKVSLSPYLKEIPDYAFDGCSNLAEVEQRTYGSNQCDVELIGDAAFRGIAIEKTTFLLSMNKLVQIGRQYVDEASIYKIGNGVTLKGLEGASDVDDKIKSISEGAEGMSDAFTTKEDGQKTNSKNERFGSEVFSNCSKLTEVTIPASVKSVATRAFYNITSLTKVKWAGGTVDRTIHSGAFQGCTALKEIELPSDGTLDIGRYAFANNNRLDTIKYNTTTYYEGFPTSLTHLGTGAFLGCTSLTSVSIKDHAAAEAPTIEDMVFEQCRSLSTATLPKSLTAIPRRMFYNDPITSFGFETGANGSQITSIGTLAFCAHQMASIDLTNYVNLTEIGSGALAAWDAVDEGTIEGKEIRCENMTNPATLVSIIMPANRTGATPTLFFGTGAFYGQTQFTTMKYSGGTNGEVYIPDYAVGNSGSDYSRAIFGKTGVSKVKWEADTTGNNQWKIIPALTFLGCTDIEKAEDVLPIGDYVEYIYKGVFYKSSIKSADLSTYTNLKEISYGVVKESGYSETGTFQECSQLTSVKFADSATYVMNVNSFDKDDKLSDVSLGGVTSIGKQAFMDDTALKSISFPASLNDIGESSFKGCTGLTKVEGWNNLSTIGNNTFENCIKLSECLLPNTLTSIGGSAFKGDAALKNMVFPCNLETIGTSAFENAGLETVDFNKATSLKTISSSAFLATKLKSFDITNTAVETVNSNVLKNCTYLESAKFGEKTQKIDKNALCGCIKLNTFEFYSETFVSREVFYDSITINNETLYTSDKASSKLNVSISAPKERTVVPLGQNYDLPYYVNAKGRSEISNILIGPGATDSSVGQMMKVAVKKPATYYWGTTQNQANKIEDPTYFESLNESKCKKYNNSDVDYVAIKPLKVGKVDVVITAGMTFDCNGKNKTIETVPASVTFQLSIEEINFHAKVFSDSTRKTEVPATVDYQVTASDTSRQCYYSMICDRDDVAFTIPCYDIVAISDNPDVVAIAATKTGTYPEGGYQTSKATNVNASTGAITANTTAMGFVVLPKKVGTATISIYPKDFVGDNRYVTTIKYNVNSDISEIKLAIPEAYKKGAPNGSTFNVFSSMKTALGDSCDATNVANMASITNQTITYESSAPEYATVDAAGNVTIINADAKANKSVKITAKAANSEKGRPVSNQVSFNILKDESLQYKVESNAVNAESTDKNSKTIVVVTTPADSVTKQGEVAIKKSTADSKATSIAVPDAVTINGIKYAVTAIKPNAYANLKNLTSVSIGSNVKTIDSKAFSGCKKLTTVNITDKSVLENIGSNAFANCKALTTVTIPKGTKTIGTKAFYNCKKLVTINVKSTVLKKVGKNALKGINKKCVINVPKKQFKKYKKLFKGKGQKKSVKVKKAF